MKATVRKGWNTIIPIGIGICNTLLSALPQLLPQQHSLDQELHFKADTLIS